MSQRNHRQSPDSKGETVIFHHWKRINSGEVQRYTAGYKPFISSKNSAKHKEREKQQSIFSPVKHLGGSVMIAACMAASGPGSVDSTDVTDNGSQMNSEAYREILSMPSHIIKESIVKKWWEMWAKSIL